MNLSFRKLICFPGLLASFYLVNGQEVKDSISTKEIQEVLIKALRKKQFSDHANYTFDKEALEKARHSKDLLTTLPELQLDPISNTVTSIKGGRTLFLINGIEATDNQIKSIAPTNVVRVEYFDIPPARYSQRADTVINIITRNPEVGYSYGADVTSALTTGFVNGSAYAGYTKVKNDFGLEYSINLRDYDNRIVDKIYDYNLNGSHYNSTEQQKDHFGYTNQNISLRYANVVTGNYTFQAKGSIFINSNFVKGLGQSLFTQDNLTENHSTIHKSNSNYTAPTLDLYYSKNIGKKDELSLNLIASHYTTNSSQFDHEWNIADNSDVFNNDMNLKAKQTGIVGEIAHVHSFENGKLSSGYRISNTAISNDLVNLFGSSHYDVNYLEQYLYTEYSGKWDKLGYRVGFGVTNIHNKSAETTQDDWAPNPKIALSYELSKNQMLRLYVDYGPHSPNSASLSKNIVQVVPNIVQYGNPYLKSYGDYYGNIQYSFNNKFVDLNSIIFYEYKPKAYNQFFIEIDNGFGLTYENTEYTRDIGLQFSGSVKPFGNKLLVLKAFIVPASTKVKTVNGKEITNNQIRNNFVISSEYKSFYIQYQFSIPTNMLYGAFLTSTENANNIFASYKLKEWAFTAGMYWMGMPSEYKTKSLPESVVDYTRISRIYNNKNMFVLGLSYDFSSGKKLQVQRKLKNNTAPASIF
ncbi:outer membrane beta-barrel protein [Chryseobacterium manosquense]|uniref:Outer membrane beta-barrel protein n=1 Tax=Chryseobacterium manosquense TaxID=2754694 RepID=A0A7H1DXE1_9FLAO|nr:outer membrane beta-barrel protein [Chryseobacterium manosquense]QNS41649.1 outer membrane beta-barrel protein [Chryseobacterium manosquense]